MTRLTGTADRLRHAVSGRTILLTGAARGVGADASRRLADAGAKVLLALHPAAPEADAVSVYRADPATPADMRVLAEQLLDEHGRLDIVIHHTGRPPRRPGVRPCCRTHAVQHLLNTHYVGPSMLIRGLLPALRTDGSAQLINVSPAHLRVPLPSRWGGHRASKTAFDVWFRGLASKAHADGVTTTSVYTGLGSRRADAVALICDAITLRPRQIAPWWLR